MARPAWDPGAAGRKPQRSKLPISQEGSDVLAPLREWWSAWKPESLWPSDIVEKVLGEGMYRTLRRGEAPEGAGGKETAEHQLFSLLAGLEPSQRDFVIHSVADRAYSGPQAVERMARRISSPQVLSLPPDIREQTVQRILDEEQSAVYDTAAGLLYDPLTWASFLPWGSWAKTAGASIVGKLPWGAAVKETVMRQLPRIAVNLKWARPLRVVASMVDDAVRAVTGWGDEAVRYRAIIQNLQPEVVAEYCDAAGIPQEQKEQYMEFAEELLGYYTNPRGALAEYREQVRAKEVEDERALAAEKRGASVRARGPGQVARASVRLREGLPPAYVRGDSWLAHHLLRKSYEEMRLHPELMSRSRPYQDVSVRLKRFGRGRR